MIEIDLLEHQVDFLEDQDHLYLGLIGGYRSGKTFCLCHKAIYMASQNIGYRGALLEPTHSMLKRVLVPTMMQVLGSVGLRYTYRASDPHSFTLHFPHGDAEILLLSAENYQRIAGVSLAYWGADEFDLIPHETASNAFNMLVSRLTKANIMQGFITSTPEGYAFLYELFVEKSIDDDGNQKTDRRLIRARTMDNPFIDENYIPRMREMYPKKALEAYLNGDFVNLNQSSVYYSYDQSLNDTKLLIDSFHPTFPIHIGVDFNVGIMASIVGMISNDGTAYIIDEIFGAQNTEDLCRKIKDKYPNRQIHVYPDASGAARKSSASTTDIAILRNAGFEVHVKTSNPRVKDRINSVNALLCNGNATRRLFINRSKCPKLSKSLSQQSYVNGEPDKSNGIDHPLDSLGYFVYWHYPVTSNNGNRIIIT